MELQEANVRRVRRGLREKHRVSQHDKRTFIGDLFDVETSSVVIASKVVYYYLQSWIALVKLICVVGVFVIPSVIAAMAIEAILKLMF